MPVGVSYEELAASPALARRLERFTRPLFRLGPAGLLRKETILREAESLGDGRMPSRCAGCRCADLARALVGFDLIHPHWPYIFGADLPW